MDPLSVVLAMAVGGGALIVGAHAPVRAGILLAIAVVAFFVASALGIATFEGFECERADCDEAPTAALVVRDTAVAAWILFGLAAVGRHVRDRATAASARR